MTYSTILCGALALLAASLPLPVAAQDSAPDSTLPEEAERLMDQGFGSLMQALDLLLKTVPQYAAPEVQPNGDIIIRRLHPEEETPRRDETPERDGDIDDSTET